ncbi:hypothetical protein [Butyricicoccus pullicaecorum]|uniref:Glycine-rich domain-containing protein n=1 Tax=Butyricicoccus pullicaecorum 1.2 TaxID=1203606 RepID=R8VZF4_9FIRM|nr:hypothetical protein [Butyricicoccus pullicaecorum]EOQ37938.1 hypothetical protein HMPREF1526_00966 [Butyricicoccus pullicaecorum 1.2]SKA60703.1 hypothetical protein SAMN02745978_01946 [Butyricicoccus pullicaecorum DSM 23266]
MQDRVPTPGKENRVRIRLDDGQKIEGVFEYADEASVQGSAYNKSNVLPDDVCNLLGITTSAEPKDAFSALVKNKWREIARITSSQTFEVPDGVYRIGAFLLGGGASGAALQVGSHGGTVPGGPSGYIKNVIIDVQPHQQIEAIIGAGGIPTSAGISPGGDTVFAGVTAKGGGSDPTVIASLSYDSRPFYQLCGAQPSVALDDNSDADLNYAYTYTRARSGADGILPILETDLMGLCIPIVSSIAERSNVFDPSMTVCACGACARPGTAQTTAKETDLGTGGAAFVDMYGGDATGYGNGGGASISSTWLLTGGKGSQGIIIIYV